LLHTMKPSLVEPLPAPGSMPSVLRAPNGVSAVPTLLVVFEGVMTSAPQTMKPLLDNFTWNFGELKM
jgi:hypothetical protein